MTSITKPRVCVCLTLGLFALATSASANADNWTFTNTRIQAADGSSVAVKDSNKVTGLPAK